MYMAIHSYKELHAWQFAYQLVKDIYVLTKDFPTDERFGLVTQLRRAAVSVPSNIAEGYNRKSKGEYMQFCYIAYGSANEVETQLMIAKDLQMAQAETFEKTEQTLQMTLKVLGSLCRSLRS